MIIISWQHTTRLPLPERDLEVLIGTVLRRRLPGVGVRQGCPASEVSRGQTIDAVQVVEADGQMIAEPEDLIFDRRSYG